KPPSAVVLVRQHEREPMRTQLRSMAIVAALAGSAPAFAQAQTPQRRPDRQPAVQDVLSFDARVGPPETVPFDLSFPGGTLETLVAALRHAARDLPNIVLSEAVRSFKVPSLELRACQVEPALQAICHVIEPKVEVKSTGAFTFAIMEDQKAPRPG